MALLLSREDLRPVFVGLEGADRLVELVAEAYAAAPTELERERPQIRTAAGDGPVMAVMASAAPSLGIGVRMGPDPAAEGAILPPEVALLFDRARHLLAVMAGDDFNLVRIAGPTAAAVRYLAPASPRALAMIGSGFEARGHLPLLLKVLPSVREVRVYSPMAANRERYAREMCERVGIPVTAVESGKAAVHGAQVVIGTADAKEPAFPADAVEPGALVAAIARVQIPGALVTQARLIVAQLHLHVLGSGRTHGPQSGENADEWATTQPAGELQDIIHGKIPARERDDQTVLYRLIGLPGTDTAILRWAYDWAVAHGVGTHIPIGTLPT